MYHLWTEKLDMMCDEILFKYSEYVLCHTYTHSFSLFILKLLSTFLNGFKKSVTTQFSVIL